MSNKAKENAATSAKVNCVKTSVETVQFHLENSPEWAGVPENYRRVAKMLVYALQLTETDVSAWHGLSKILAARLTPKERGALAWAVLRALTPEQIMATVEASLPQGAGQPVPPLFSFMDQAAFWADMAAPEELEAYCFNSFNRMPAKRQAAFLDFVQGRKVA